MGATVQGDFLDLGDFLALGDFLDFGDFLASVNLTEDQQNAGNNSLRPQQNWDFTMEVAKNFGAWGSATLTLFDERIEDLVLIVPVAGGGEAGNEWHRGPKGPPPDGPQAKDIAPSRPP